MIPVLHGVWSAGAVAADYEHIETITVGAGGAASVTFSSIPGTYKHLQIRAIVSSSRGGSTWPTDTLVARFNGDTGNNYAAHFLRGNGASATSGVPGTLPVNAAVWSDGVVNTAYSSVTLGANVIDILDYSNTSKNKTVRALSGADINGTWGSGSGLVGLYSTAWLNTSAITSILLYAFNANLAQHSTFALYGVK